MLHPFILELHSCPLEPITGGMGVSVPTLLGLLPTVVKDLLVALLKGNELLAEGERPLKLQFLRSGPQGTTWDTSFPVKVEPKNSWTLPKKELRKIGRGPYPISSASYLKLVGTTNEDPRILNANLQRLSGPGQLLEGVLIRMLHFNEKAVTYWMGEIFNGVNIYGDQSVSIYDWETKRYFQAPAGGHPPSITKFVIKTIARGADPLSTKGSPRRPLYEDLTPLSLYLEKHDLRDLWSVDGLRFDLMKEISECKEHYTLLVENEVRRRFPLHEGESQEERLIKARSAIDKIVSDASEE